MKKDERVEYCLDWLRRVQRDNVTLNEDRAEALKALRADSTIVDAPENTSKATTTDLMDTIEWIKPALLEIFTGGDEITKLTPVGEEDVIAVKNQEMLTNYQMRVKNPWFQIFHDWLDDALNLKTGVVKYQWRRKVEFVEKEYEDLSPEQYQGLTLKVKQEWDSLRDEDLEDAPEMFVKDVQVFPDSASVPVGYNATFIHAIQDEGPLIEAIPSEDFGFMHTLTREIVDAPFVYHRARYTKQKFIKKYGKAKFKEVEDVLETLGETKEDSGSTTAENMGNETLVAYERLKDLLVTDSGFFSDKKSGEYFIYECYYPDPDTGKPVITAISAQTLLAHGGNKYGKPIFRVISPFRKAHRASGLGMWDLLKDFQKIRTAILREVLNNLYFGNKKRAFVDPNRVNIDDYQDNRPGVMIRVKSQGGTIADAVVPEIKAPLPDGIFQFWEMMNMEKDLHSGVPRSFQGTNPRILNKTFRGQNQQINQASQRVTMMARIIAEIGVAPLVNDIIDLNIRFLKKKQAIRYLNEWVEISPDNIVCKCDIAVNVGLGTGNKGEMITNLQQILALYKEVHAVGVPIVSSRNVYNVFKELLRAMGFKNTGDFIENPKFLEAVKELVSLLAQLLQNPQAVDEHTPHIQELVGKLIPHLGLETGGAQGRGEGEEGQISSSLLGRMVPAQPANPFAMTDEGGGGNGEEVLSYE